MRAVPPLACTWQNIALTVLKITDRTGRIYVEHVYPGRDGAEVEDMGAEPARFDIEAVLWGPRWADDLFALQASAELPLATGTGTFVHPFRGTMRGVIRGLTVSHQDTKHDFATVNFTFVEASGTPAAFATSASSASAVAAAQAAAATAAAAVAALGV